MNRLLFFSRVALLCNVCFAFMVVARNIHFNFSNGFITGTILVLGIAAVFVNLFVSLFWLLALVRRKGSVPVWMGALNLIFLFVELIATFIYLV